MKSRTDSGELREKINLYFDHALNKDEEKSLLDRVQNDTRCSSMFNKEKNFREFIKSNVKRSSVSPDLIKTIRSRINID